MITEIEAGPVYDLPEDEYHSRPELSASMAKILIQPGGPAKLRHQLDTPRVEKKTFDFGHAAHQLVLGKGAPIAVIPDDLLASNGAASTAAAKAFIAEAREAGQVPLKSVEAQQVADMADALTRHTEASEVLQAQGRHVELSAFAQDAQTGVQLRCRFDLVAPTVVADYKTAVDAEPGRFARQTMLNLGYHVQAAHYLDMAHRLGLASSDAGFAFVVQEKEAPYLPAVVWVGDEYLDLGRRDMRRAIDLWAECNRTGVWPGYPTTVAVPPKWALDEAETELDPTTEAELLALIERTAS